YTDALMITAEPFALWAIESGSARVQELLSFAAADNRIVIAPDIEKFRELKLRLLNGAHTFTCALAHLNGFTSVKEAMHDEAMARFVRRLVILEIAESIDSALASYNEACAFANSVLDRFRNPFLEHRWLSIALNYTAKMRMRNIPLLLRYYQQHNKVPVCMALGFAAYIRFMCVLEQPDGSFTGKWNGRNYTIQDEHTAFFAEKWALISGRDLVHAVLSQAELWGTDLTALPGFEAQVTEDLLQLEEGDPAALLTIEYLNKSFV
ncbi:MAG: altronate oxidoreductase, partial [Chitinophagaceae bacterium]|nr:altronate oxidoreductase [Chitinophagaceae bacterium]